MAERRGPPPRESARPSVRREGERPSVVADFASIVIRCSPPDPTLVTPDWLVEQSLISVAAREKAVMRLLIPHQAIEFEAVWLSCKIADDVVQLATTDPAEFERLRDLAVGLVRLLPSLEPRMLGINRVAHLAFEGQDKWNRFGDTLVQNELWSDNLILSGMKSVTFQGVRPDLYGGFVDVRFEPSAIQPNGVFVSYNDHYELVLVLKQPEARGDTAVPSDEQPDRSALVVEILGTGWTDSMNRFESILKRAAELSERGMADGR